jgi:hypothetical protein
MHYQGLVFDLDVWVLSFHGAQQKHLGPLAYVPLKG